MKSLLFFALLPLLMNAEEIISEFEYGQMLYNNPRGVSCMPCHGIKGEGREIVSYRDKGEEKVLSAPNIIKKSFKEYKRAIKKGPKIMPKYFLTDEELRAIYSYIQKANSLRVEVNQSKMVKNIAQIESEIEKGDSNEINGDGNATVDFNLSGKNSEFNKTVVGGGIE